MNQRLESLYPYPMSNLHQTPETAATNACRTPNRRITSPMIGHYVPDINPTPTNDVNSPANVSKSMYASDQHTIQTTNPNACGILNCHGAPIATLPGSPSPDNQIPHIQPMFRYVLPADATTQYNLTADQFSGGHVVHMQPDTINGFQTTVLPSTLPAPYRS